MNRRWFLGLAVAAAIGTFGNARAEEIGGEINILSWGNYIDFALPGFEEKYGVKVNIDYYADEQEAMNKIRAAGLGTHDVVFLGAGFEDIAIKQALLAPLDLAKLPSLADVYPKLKKVKDDGKVYCATYSFGLNGLIAYDSDQDGRRHQVLGGRFLGQVQGPRRQDRQVERADLAYRPEPRLQVRPAFRRAVGGRRSQAA